MFRCLLSLSQARVERIMCKRHSRYASATQVKEGQPASPRGTEKAKIYTAKQIVSPLKNSIHLAFIVGNMGCLFPVIWIADRAII